MEEDDDMKLFDWKFYVSKYSDLKRSGINTLKKAKTHWLKFGKIEGRCCFAPPQVPSFETLSELLINKVSESPILESKIKDIIDSLSKQVETLSIQVIVVKSKS